MKINIFWKYHFDMKIFGKCENISYFLNSKYLKVWVLVLQFDFVAKLQICLNNFRTEISKTSFQFQLETL